MTTHADVMLMLPSGYNYHVRHDYLESVDAQNVQSWLEQHVGPRVDCWTVWVDPRTFEFIFLFKQENDAILFSLTWL